MRDSEYINCSIIGISGSGKTMALSGFREAFISGCSAGDNGTTITATGSRDDANFRGSDEDGKLSGIFSSAIMDRYKQTMLMACQDKNGKIGSSAAGTVDMSHFYFDWDVYIPGSVELSQTIKLTDYRGGILSLNAQTMTENDIAECRALMDNLTHSDVIVLLLDGIKLAQYKDNISLRKEKTGANRINVLMNALMKEAMRGITVLVMVTKVDSDKIPMELKVDNYKNLCTLACGTIDSVYMKSNIMARNYGWNFGVIPVSAIGDDNAISKYVPEIDEYYSVLKYNADVHQKNIDVAMIYCLKNALSERFKYMSQKVNDCDSKINDELNKPGIFNLGVRKETIKYLRNEKQELEKKRDKYMSMLSAINDGFSNRFSAVRRFGAVK